MSYAGKWQERVQWLKNNEMLPALKDLSHEIGTLSALIPEDGGLDEFEAQGISRMLYGFSCRLEDLVRGRIPSELISVAEKDEATI